MKKQRCKWCNSNNTKKNGSYHGNQYYYCNSCKRKFSMPKIIEPYPCIECGTLIKDSTRIDKNYCDECIYQHQLECQRKWRKQNRTYVNKKDLECYYKKLFTGRILGTSGNGSSLSRDHRGNPDFEKEKKVIKRIKNSVMAKGNSWITFGVFARYNYKSILVWESYAKIPSETKLVLNWCEDIPFPTFCSNCNSGIIIMPENPRTYDFDRDGFLMPFCSDCGLVVE